MAFIVTGLNSIKYGKRRSKKGCDHGRGVILAFVCRL